MRSLNSRVAFSTNSSGGNHGRSRWQSAEIRRYCIARALPCHIMVSTLRPLWRVSTHIGAWVGVELCEERTLAYCGQAKLEERKSTSNMPDDVPRAGGSGRA